MTTRRPGSGARALKSYRARLCDTKYARHSSCGGLASDFGEVPLDDRTALAHATCWANRANARADQKVVVKVSDRNLNAVAVRNKTIGDRRRHLGVDS